MQTVDSSYVSKTITRLFLRAETMLPPEIGMKIECASEKPAESDAGRAALSALLEHFIYCGLNGTRLCPSTEEAVVYAARGKDSDLSTTVLFDAIQRGIATAYFDLPVHPTAVIHITDIPGTKLHLTVQPRSDVVTFHWSKPSSAIGFNHSTFSAWAMEQLKNRQEILSFPVFLGIGAAINVDTAEALADQALLHYMDIPNTQSYCAKLETKLLLDSYRMGIGPNGVPGKQAVLGIHVTTDCQLNIAQHCIIKAIPALLRRAEAWL